MDKLSIWLLAQTIKFRRWSLDRQLAQHVLVCTGRKSGFGKCTRDLENCDEGEFCKIGRPLFNQSFDMTFLLGGISAS